MKALKRIGAAIALTFVLAFAAFADCLPPVPGEVNAPPCLGAQITPDVIHFQRDRNFRDA